MQLDFEIDKLTRSLEDATTGDIFPTEVLLLEKADLKLISKKSGWKFNWKAEFVATEKQVYKLILQNQPDVIQGLICFTNETDHIFMQLIETAPHNFGKAKKYLGVSGNLVAFGCKLSFEKGFEGCMAFIAKTKLIPHYEKELGAELLWGQRMSIETNAAINLINRYFPEFFNQIKQ
jgi:hypothetical protein